MTGDALSIRLGELAGGPDVPSLVALTATRGEPVRSFAEGWADAERRVAPSHDTMYGLGSVTKAYTALTALTLVAEGRLSLDAPVQLLLGTELPVLAGVTAPHLLTHTSGLPPPDSRHWALDRAAPGEWTGGASHPSRRPPTVSPGCPR